MHMKNKRKTQPGWEFLGISWCYDSIAETTLDAFWWMTFSIPFLTVQYDHIHNSIIINIDHAKSQMILLQISNYKWMEFPSFDYLDNHSSDRLHTCGCIAEDPRKCSVEWEVVWKSDSWESCKQQYWRPNSLPIPNRHALSGHCTSHLLTHQKLTNWLVKNILCCPPAILLMLA